MPVTVTYSFELPTIGGDVNAWGTDLNANWTALDGLLAGVNPIAPNLVGWSIGGVDVTATAAELNILDGATVTAAELNILDGATATTAELNILDGATVTAAELNILDGATLTTAELNHVDGVTSNIQTQLNTKLASADAPALTQVQVEDDTSTVVGRVSGQRLAQAVVANVDYAVGNAALSAGGVGTYVFGGAEVNLELGDTVAGSSLAPVGLYSSGGYTRTLGSPLTGTWRCMGKNTTDGSRPSTLYLRIS